MPGSTIARTSSAIQVDRKSFPTKCTNYTRKYATGDQRGQHQPPASHSKQIPCGKLNYWRQMQNTTGGRWGAMDGRSKPLANRYKFISKCPDFKMPTRARDCDFPQRARAPPARIEFSGSATAASIWCCFLAHSLCVGGGVFVCVCVCRTICYSINIEVDKFATYIHQHTNTHRQANEIAIALESINFQRHLAIRTFGHVIRSD